MKYTITGDFTRISSSSGTVQNLSTVQLVEVSNSNALGTGVLLRPLEKISFSGNIYVRCPAGGRVDISVVPFGASSGGSSSSDTTSGGESSGDSTFDADINDMWDNLPDSSDTTEFDSDINNLWDNP